jgi:hypothetical protein
MSGKFEPKTEVHLNPPKDDPITVEELAKYDGSNPDLPIYVAMKVQPPSPIHMSKITDYIPRESFSTSLPTVQPMPQERATTV